MSQLKLTITFFLFKDVDDKKITTVNLYWYRLNHFDIICIYNVFLEQGLSRSILSGTAL